MCAPLCGDNLVRIPFLDEAGGHERHPVPATHRLLLAPLAARRVSAALDGVARRSGWKGVLIVGATGWSSARSPGSDETGVSPRTLRTLPKPWSPSLRSPPSNWASGGSLGRRPCWWRSAKHGQQTSANTEASGGIAPKAAICTLRSNCRARPRLWENSDFQFARRKSFSISSI
jgi:hypothetical protein